MVILEMPDSAVRQSDDRQIAEIANGQFDSEHPQEAPNANVQGGAGGQVTAELPLASGGFHTSDAEDVQGKNDTVDNKTGCNNG